MAERWRMCEVDLVHNMWERISKENNVLDLASNNEERKILALILEDRRRH